MRQPEQSGNKKERKTMRNEEWGRNEEEMGECCFVGFPRLLHHQSTLQPFKDGQLRFVVSQLFIDTLKHLYTCAQIHTFSLTTTNIIHILPLVAICLSVCAHLKNSAADVPVTAVTPDPKLSVVVRLTVRYPIPARDKQTNKNKMLTLCSCSMLFILFSCYLS